MKVQIDKEWCVAMAQQEGDAEIGAGPVAFDPIPPGPCLECDGSGWLDDECTQPCCDCDGSGLADD